MGKYDVDRLQIRSYHHDSSAAWYPLWDVLHILQVDLSSRAFLAKTSAASTLTALRLSFLTSIVLA